MGLFDFLGRVKDQVDVLDNGKTFKNPSGNGKTSSVVGQAGTLGFNFIKGFTKPFVAAGAEVSNAIGNAEVGVAHKLGLAKNVKTQTNEQQFGKTVGSFVGTNTPLHFLANTAGIGLTLASGGIAGGVEGGVADALGGGALAKVAGGATAGAALGAPFSVANTLSSEGPINAKTLTKSALEGAGTGALLGGVTEGIKVGAENATPLHPSETGSISLGEGEAEKIAKADTSAEVKKILGDKVDNQTASALAATKDSHVVENIVKGTNDIPAEVPTPTIPSPKDVKTAIEAEAQRQAPLPDVANPAQVGQAPIQDITSATVPKPQGFAETIANSKNSTPELQQGAKDIVQQGTETKSNQALADNAKTRVAENYDAALEQVKNTKNLTDEDVAVGQELVRKAQSEGRISDAVDIVENLDQKLRESGRAVQAASLWDKLSPEGVLRLAERKIRQAREGFKDTAKEGDTANTIKNAVEGYAKLDQGDVAKTVKEIANEKPVKEQATTGEKLAKKVENQVTPQVKKQADTLVEELSKKVRQELLPEKAGTTPKSATQVLREVFGRNKEAQAAFPEAQRILQEKFADNPKALATLDKFFTSELGLPAAETTISSAIREQLKANGESVSNIIYKSLADQGASVDSISQSLVKEGFDKPSADALAKEVSTRLNKQLGEAKATVLQRLSEDAKPKAQTTYLDKLNKLSNLGALGNEDYLALARAKLDLPQLTTETASKLTDLSQKLQSLGENDPARYETIRQIGEVINEAAPTPGPSVIKQVLGSPKSALASYDISGVGRQGAFLGTRFPAELATAFKKQVEYFHDENAYNNDMARIAADPLAPLAKQAGLALTGIKEFGKPEEAFPSLLPEKIPFFGKGIKASDRSFTGALTVERFEVFKHIMNGLKEDGVDINNMPESHIKSIGRYINTSSARGELGDFLEKHSSSLGEALFSPRLWKSRLDVLNPKYYYDLKGPARALALQNAATFAGTAATVLGIAAAAGATVQTDARSSDFLKIKVGNTRYDILGGFQQNLVFAWRELSGQKKSSTTGGVTDLTSGKFGGANRASILGDLIQSKENPIFSTGATLLSGKDKIGNKVNPYTTIGNLLVPLNIQDTYKTIKDTGNIPEGLAKATIPGTVGIGVNTYGVKDIALSDTQKHTISKLTDKNQQQAYTSFYQISKQAAGTRQNVSDAVNAALASGDTAKAQKLASDYNRQYASNFKDWASKYSQYSDKTLTKDYNSNKINLTKASLKTRLKAIKAKQ